MEMGDGRGARGEGRWEKGEGSIVKDQRTNGGAGECGRHGIAYLSRYFPVKATTRGDNQE